MPTAPTSSEAETQLELLEEKIQRALELLAQARKAREAAEREAARLRAELADKTRQWNESERERSEVRRRIERLLKQIDTLTDETAGA